MDPHGQFCHNRRCRTYGRSGEGHVVIHSPQGAPLSLQALRADLLRKQRYCPLPSTKAEVAGTRGGYVACLRLSGAGHLRRLQPRLVHRRPLAEGIRLAMQAGT
jgi:hypothetical protein